ncbi:Os10g0211800 [Oryza sativa Japonica Group]|uniref:Os10g0211800 protein n=2 Tax=Oryza sativa subsp. japonica TaxID=39947 RepID=Q8LM81_ORYSJ|nr:Hypothetical protein [Oryza sativa Japonica Group]AAP52806.1 hypothetical protein LOC_Os10g15150 [Oryza sativa Japonica Group]EAZ15626.1 hypothetical protein OsJ_31034 [Oryza sativa Japonica Group]BAT10280.1 Os10g0211800 [Oryza sativa Japonica Group]
MPYRLLRGSCRKPCGDQGRQQQGTSFLHPCPLRQGEGRHGDVPQGAEMAMSMMVGDDMVASELWPNKEMAAKTVAMEATARVGENGQIRLPYGHIQSPLGQIRGVGWLRRGSGSGEATPALAAERLLVSGEVAARQWYGDVGGDRRGRQWAWRCGDFGTGPRGGRRAGWTVIAQTLSSWRWQSSVLAGSLMEGLLHSCRQPPNLPVELLTSFCKELHWEVEGGILTSGIVLGCQGIAPRSWLILARSSEVAGRIRSLTTHKGGAAG